jgi:hypothetical protein
MFSIKSFCSSLRLLHFFLLFILAAVVPPSAIPQAVPSQANIDASAQRRLQETAREAQRQHRIEEEIRKISPALAGKKLAGAGGPVLARLALAALVRLRNEGISPDEALTRAARSTGLDHTSAAKPSAYLRNLFAENSGKVTPPVLAKLEAGQDPAPALTLPAYVP